MDVFLSAINGLDARERLQSLQEKVELIKKLMNDPTVSDEIFRDSVIMLLSKG